MVKMPPPKVNIDPLLELKYTSSSTPSSWLYIDPLLNPLLVM